MNLNIEQRRAVEAEGQDVCVVAGPGSGKTRVLTHRFEWLVERGVPPRRILAITFTEKAATEIKKRLVEAFRSREELQEQIERAYVSTVHGFCARLLREHAIAAGVDPEFAVLDENEAEALEAGAAEEVLDGWCRRNPAGMRALLDNLCVSSNPSSSQPDLSAALRAIRQAMRVAGVSPGDLRREEAVDPRAALDEIIVPLRDALGKSGAGSTPAQRVRVAKLHEWLRAAPLDVAPGARHFAWLDAFPGEKRGLPQPVLGVVKEMLDGRIQAVQGKLIRLCNAPLYDLVIEMLEAIGEACRARKRSAGVLDFCDLEEFAIALLREHPAVRERVAGQFDAILMDELQDTNPLQWTLLELLRRPRRLFAVGDVNQSIFGFRHAEPAVFRRFRSSVAQSGQMVQELRQNYRSRKEILAAVNAVFRSAEGIEPHTLTASDEYAPRAGPAVEILVAEGATAAEASRREAAWIAHRIRELKRTLTVGKRDRERPAGYRDFAVLARSLNALEPVRAALEAAGIPALLAGGRTFFETREVRDVTEWLTVLVNPRDEVSLAGVLRSPLAAVSDEALLRLRLAFPGNLADALARLDERGLPGLDVNDLERLLEFRRLLDGQRPWRDSLSPDRLALRALDACDYFTGLTAHERSNLEKFLAMLREGWESRPLALAERLAELARLRAAESEPEAPPDGSDAVHLMSVHRAKGLEYPVVFVVSLQRLPERDAPPVCFDPVLGLGARWRNPSGGKAVADDAHLRCAKERGEREEAEEDRLLYVAMTRAEERLALSWTVTAKRGGVWNRMVEQGLALNLEALGPDPVSLPSAAAGIHVRCFRAQRDPDPDQAGPRAAEQEPERVKIPAAGGGYESSAPVTALAEFVLCPRSYYLGRYLGAPAAVEVWREDVAGEERGEPGADEFGRQVHALLAGEEVPEADSEARALAASFASSPLGARVARAQRVEREFAFVMAIDGVVLRGQIDLWFEEGGELLLADYKTGWLEAGDQAALERYAIQVRLYALALQAFLGRKPDAGLLHLLRTGETVAVDLSAAALERTRAAVAEFKQAHARFRFPPRLGPACGGCRFRGAECPPSGA